MMAWVAAVVRVIAHWICGFWMRSVSVENGSGGSSPGCISSAAQSMVVPSSRGGVPVFSRPSAKPARSSVRESPIAGASPTRPAGICRSPIWMRPRRNVPVVSTTSASAIGAAVGQPDAGDAVAREQIVDLAFDHRQVRLPPDRRLHGRGVKLAVGLGARAAHGRTLAAIEEPELDAGGVGDAAHEAVERVDLAHQVPFAEPADRGIAGHGADGRKPLGDQRRTRAHARGRGRGLTAGMAAANDNHIEAGVHPRSSGSRRLLANANAAKITRNRRRVSRETYDSAHGVNQSFTNAEIAENNVEDVLDIDPAGQPAERRRRRPQFLGDQLFAPGAALGQRPVQRRNGVLQRPAVTGAGHEGGFCGREIIPGEGRERRYECIRASPGGGRNRECHRRRNTGS